MEDIINKIYIDLDSLLDTRIALLYRINKNIMPKLFKDDYYYMRYYDEFDIVSNYMFNKFYKNRNKNLLKYSFVTKLLKLLLTEIELLNSKLVMTNSNDVVEVDINVYPYKLTDTEKKLYKKTLETFMIIDTVIINIVDIDVKDITFDVVGSTYNIMFMYDGVKWLDYRLANELTPSAIYTRLYSPALLLDAIVIDKVSNFEKLLESQVKLYEPYINFMPIDVDNFCLIKENEIEYYK